MNRVEPGPSGAVPGASAQPLVRIVSDPQAVDLRQWNALLARQPQPTPFMRLEYLRALHASGSAVAATGWAPHFVLLQDGASLLAACPLYAKSHSWGEYVFDFAWARAYAEHGLDYYPKAVVAVPFTPVPGTRLMARDAAARSQLLRALLGVCEDRQWSSLHLLFAAPPDLEAAAAAGFARRDQVQFHWHNQHPATGQPFADFNDFLQSLRSSKRKKIRHERRQVAAAGVTFRCLEGAQITASDWDFFYRCYERTYLEHGNPPYLSRDFFARMARELPDCWVLFLAERNGRPMACSLLARTEPGTQPAVAYGRYWGALERVDFLHFEACYYQPLAWCMRHGMQRFEGGAQGEHKLARGMVAARTHSAHWMAHPAFHDAVVRYLAQEGRAEERYLHALRVHTPFKRGPGGAP